MSLIGPREIAGVLAVTDALGIHREAVRVPLDPVPGGSVSIVADAVVIEFPSDGEPADFIPTLSSRLESLPGLQTLKRSEEQG